MTAHGFPHADARLVVARALDEDLSHGTDVTTVATIPADQVTIPLAESKCPLVKKE